jgi:hypothetical protein
VTWFLLLRVASMGNPFALHFTKCKAMVLI